MKTYLFGSFNFGTFTIGGNENEMCIIQRLDRVRAFASEEEAEAYFDSRGFDSWCVDDGSIEIVEAYAGGAESCQ